LHREERDSFFLEENVTYYTGIPGDKQVACSMRNHGEGRGARIQKNELTFLVVWWSFAVNGSREYELYRKLRKG